MTAHDHVGMMAHGHDGPVSNWAWSMTVPEHSDMRALLTMFLTFARFLDGPHPNDPRCPALGCRVWILCSITNEVSSESEIDKQSALSIRQGKGAT